MFLKSNIEINLSKAIKEYYNKVFKTKTEYSSLSIMGFYDKDIIQQLITDVEFFPIFLKIKKFIVVTSNIGYIDENIFHGVSAREDEYKLEIYLKSEHIIKIMGKILDKVLNQLEIYKKHAGTYLLKLQMGWFKNV
ncbi:36173_t:CDS:2 [Gigaspora margarita]|uniref:36173_t:CDS:1 n=1 Tax=Gigaspora margarita TaxID=4874 RepID=A0ABN7V9J6_GIGMA|nr:36173_t:CDS:2 [Gigaspora margarita]